MELASCTAAARRSARRSDAIENEKASRRPTRASTADAIVVAWFSATGAMRANRRPSSRPPSSEATVTATSSQKGAVYSQLIDDFSRGHAPTRARIKPSDGRRTVAVALEVGVAGEAALEHAQELARLLDGHALLPHGVLGGATRARDQLVLGVRDVVEDVGHRVAGDDVVHLVAGRVVERDVHRVGVAE